MKANGKANGTRSRLAGLLRLLRRNRWPEVGLTPTDVVHEENKWRLLRFRGAAAATQRTPVLLVPSLINRYYVLDLQPGRSFAEYLVDRGHDVYIIDWGTPGPEDRFLTFDDICDRYLGRAVRITSRASGSVHLLGYCLGGTLTTIYTAARPERIASLTAVAAPIDFHDDGLLSLWSRTSTFDVEALVEATGNVPWRLMQASFQMLQPTLATSKAMTIVDRVWDDEFLDGMFALERWGRDNVSFPGACYAQYIGRLYRDNALLSGDMLLSERPARLESIECPCHVVTFEHDHIVPRRSAAVLAERVSSGDIVLNEVRGGHVGAMVSRKAAAGLWRDLSSFWMQRN